MTNPTKLRSLAAPLALAAGGGLVVLGLLADTLGVGNRPGISGSQLLLCLLGCALVVAAPAIAPAGGSLRAGLRHRVAALTPVGPAAWFGIAIWFGLLTGILEVLHRGIRLYGFDLSPRRPEDMVWMAPVVYVAVDLAIGSVLWLASRGWRPIASIQVQVAVLGALALWSQTMFYPVIDPGAALLLSIAGCVQVARLAGRRKTVFLALVRRSLPWLVGLVLAAGVAVAVARDRTEANHLSQLPDARPGAPNVILIVLDTVRADHLGFHGYGPDTTPNLDRLAAGGVVFERFCSTSPWTLPAHATMFTGLWGFQHDADWLNPMTGTSPTLAETLSSQGYATAGFVGNLSYCSSEWGLDRGFSRYDDFPINVDVAAYSTVLLSRFDTDLGFFHKIRNDAAWITDRFLDWEAGVGDRPFFAFLNLFDAHAIYLPPPPFDHEFGPPSDRLFDWFEMRGDLSPEEKREFVAAYDGCIKYIDLQIARLLDRLRERGVLDETIVIVTGDHGEQFGEHGLIDHANSLYMPLLHVPLLISCPGRVPAMRVSDFASLRDLPATILDLVHPPAAGALPGHSLAPLWRGGVETAPRSPLLSEVKKGKRTAPELPVSRGDMRSIISGGQHLIINGDGVLELYDLLTDPGEERDLMATEAGKARAARLQAEIEGIVNGVR